MPTGSRSSSTCGASPKASTSSCSPSICWSSTARTYGGSRSRPARQRSPACCAGCLPGLRLNEHLTHPGDVVLRHACKLGLEGIISKRLGSRYVSGRSKTG